MNQSDNEWNLISYVFRSKYRQIILNCLINEPKTPIQISKLTNLRINHVSNVLINLLDKELIICLNPQEKRGRFYQITELGKKVNMKIIDVSK